MILRCLGIGKSSSQICANCKRDYQSNRGPGGSQQRRNKNIQPTLSSGSLAPSDSAPNRPFEIAGQIRNRAFRKGFKNLSELRFIHHFQLNDITTPIPSEKSGITEMRSKKAIKLPWSKGSPGGTSGEDPH